MSTRGSSPHCCVHKESMKEENLMFYGVDNIPKCFIHSFNCTAGWHKVFNNSEPEELEVERIII